MTLYIALTALVAALLFMIAAYVSVFYGVKNQKINPTLTMLLSLGYAVSWTITIITLIIWAVQKFTA